MRRVVLWGSGEHGLKTYELLENMANDLYKIEFWCDSNIDKIGKTINGKIVLSPLELKDQYVKKNIDLVIIAVSALYFNEVIKALKSLEITEVYFVPLNWYNEMADHNASREILWYIDTEKPMLEYYEFHVCDQCNLNCKGCGHVSNICDEHFADLKSYERDIKRLRDLFSCCLTIKLLGGEPLLNPNLDKFIETTRRHFPESKIIVGSNGLLIPKADNVLFETMRSNNVFFMVSLYPPVLKMKNEIENKCIECGVRCVFTPEIKEFSTKLYLKKRFDCQKAYDECIKKNGHCYTLRDGRISPCATFYFRMLNEKFDAGYSVTDVDDFDIYQFQNGWQLDKLLHEPIPFCAYCGEERAFTWQIANKKNVTLSDYIAEE